MPVSPPQPRTYQVPKQEDEDAHHQRAQPEETQAPIALPAEAVRSEPGTQPLPNPQPPPRPRSPLAHGCDHGEVQPVVHDAIPVTDHDAVCCAQVWLTLSGLEISQGGGEHLSYTPTPPLGGPGGSGAAFGHCDCCNGAVPLSRRPLRSPK